MLDRNLTPADFNYHLELDVRFRDCDMMNHVNNSVYSTYLEQARLGYFGNFGLDIQDRSRVGFMLIETHIRFLMGAVFGDNLRIHMRVSELKKARFNCHYLIERIGDGQKIALGWTAQMGMDLANQKLAALDSELVHKIKDFEKIS